MAQLTHLHGRVVIHCRFFLNDLAALPRRQSNQLPLHGEVSLLGRVGRRLGLATSSTYRAFLHDRLALASNYTVFSVLLAQLHIDFFISAGRLDISLNGHFTASNRRIMERIKAVFLSVYSYILSQHHRFNYSSPVNVTVLIHIVDVLLRTDFCRHSAL